MPRERCVAGPDAGTALLVHQHLALKPEDTLPAGDGDRPVPVPAEPARRQAPAVGVHQLRIKRRPLGLERRAQHRMAGLEGARFERVKRGLRGERGRVGLGQVECGQFGQVIGCPVVDAANKDADVAHGGPPLGMYSSPEYHRTAPDFCAPPILAGQPQHQRIEVGIKGRATAWPAAAEGPPAAHQLAMPAEDGHRADKQTARMPGVARRARQGPQLVGEHGEEHAVCAAQARRVDRLTLE
jgi:hypothetical protein